MKRCPQCHFTFEDFEERCDFDGSELTLLPESEPKLAVPQPLYVRILKSPLGAAALAIVALVVSGLVIGYLDARNLQSVEAPKNSDKPSEVSSLLPVRRATSKARARKATTKRPTKQLRSTGKSQLKSTVARSRKSRHQRTAVAKASPSSRSARTARSQVRPPRAVAAQVRPPRAVAAQVRPPRAVAAQVRPPRPVSGHTVATQSVPRKNDSKVTAIFKKSGSLLKKTVSFLKRPFDL